MTRRPQYTKNDQFRIISLPNGFWQLEEYDGAKGTRTFDPWQRRSPSLSIEEAQALLHSKEPQ